MLPVKKIICLLTALALLVCTLAGCGTEEDARPLYADQGEAQRGELTGVTPASDAAAILDCLAQAGQIDDLGRETVTARDNQTPGKEMSVPEPNRSVVVTDGAYIYMLDSYGLIVVSAAGAASRILSYTQVEIPGSVNARRLFVRDQRAMVVCELSELGVDDTGLSYDDAGTCAVVFDVSDPAAPKETGRTLIEGSLLEAGFLHDALCLVTLKKIWMLPQRELAQELLPWMEEGGKRTALRPTDVFLRAEPGRTTLSVVTALRLDDGRVLDALAFADTTQTAVLTADGLYLARTRWHEQNSEPDREKEPPYTVVSRTHEVGTEVLRLDLDTSLHLAGGCTQQGGLADNASMSVYNGALRLALQKQTCCFSAYTDEKHGWTNYELDSDSKSSQIVLLDAALQAAAGGMLRNIGGETGVRACRFLEDHAFLVTDKPDDPVYCADLSRTDAPAMAGSLLLPGSYARFYAMADGAVLALGEDAEHGGLTLTALQAEEGDRMQRTDRVTVKQRSRALQTPTLVFADPETGFVGLPLDGERVQYRLYRLEDGALKEKGTVALEYVPDEARGLLIDGLLYVCGPGEVYVIEPETAKLVVAVSNAVG